MRIPLAGADVSPRPAQVSAFRVPAYAADDPVGTLRMEAVFSAGKDAPGQRVGIDLTPREFSPRTRLLLPLGGEVFVHDGHDLNAHHRRLDITGGMTTHFGITANFMRTSDGWSAVYAGPVDSGDVVETRLP